MTDVDLDQAMQDVLLAMTMLSYGSTSAWDSNGGTQGKPGSRILVLVDRPIADVYRERWENANGPTSRRAILEEARRELDQWRGRADRERPETLTAQQEENLILEEGKGFDVLLVAQRFRTSATRVRKLRTSRGLHGETGEPTGHADDVATMRRLKDKGMSQRQIAALLGCSQQKVNWTLNTKKAA